MVTAPQVTSVKVRVRVITATATQPVNKLYLNYSHSPFLSFSNHMYPPLLSVKASVVSGFLSNSDKILIIDHKGAKALQFSLYL